MAIGLNVPLPLLTGCVSSFPEESFLCFELEPTPVSVFITNLCEVSSLYKDFKASCIAIECRSLLRDVLPILDSDMACPLASFKSLTAPSLLSPIIPGIYLSFPPLLSSGEQLSTQLPPDHPTSTSVRVSTA